MQTDVRAKTFFQTAAIVGGLLTVSTCVVWATWPANRPRTLPAAIAIAAEPAGNPAAPHSPAATADTVHVGNALSADEQRVRDYIIDHEDDAGSVEFASWGPHDLKGELHALAKEHKKIQPFPDGSNFKVFRVRYRSKSDVGALRLHDVLAYRSDRDGSIFVVENLGRDDWLKLVRNQANMNRP